MRLALVVLLLVAASAKVTIYFTNSFTISDLTTLTSNVAYTINMTLPNVTIPANSFVLLQFSQRFIINSTTVTLCQYLISGTSYTPITCQTSFNGPNAKYEISLRGIYPSTVTNQTNLRFQVLLS